MKKYLIAFLLVGTILLGGVSQAKAVSLSDLMEQVASLQAQVAKLSSQLSALAIDSITASKTSTTSISTSTKTTTVDPSTTSSIKDTASTTTDTKVVVPTTTSTDKTLATSSVTTSTDKTVVTQPTNTNTTTTQKDSVTTYTSDQSQLKPTYDYSSTSSGSYSGDKDKTTSVKSSTGSNSQGSTQEAPKTNLSYAKKGDTGDAVIALQKVLIEKGFLPSDIKLGYYGIVTTNAVAEFQKANDISGDGTIVGPKTIKSLASGGSGSPTSIQSASATLGNQLACSTTNTTPQIKVIYPNGGEIFTAGQQITVKWKTCNIPVSQNVSIEIERGVGPNNWSQSWNTLLGNTLNDGSETFTIPTFPTYGSQMFRVLITSSIVGSQGDRSDSGFTINGPQTSCTFGSPTFVSSSSTSSQYVAGGTTTGTTDATKATFKFTTSGCGNATITELGYKDVAGEDALTQVRVGSSTAPVASNKAFIYNLSIPIPQSGSGANVDAFASYSSVGPTGLMTTITGDIDSSLKLSYVKYVLNGVATTLCANGDGPGGINCINSFSMPVAANPMILVGSKPVVTASQPGYSVLVSSSMNEAIDVTVTANTAGSISIQSLPILSTLATTSGVPLFDTVQPMVKDHNNNFVPTTGSNCQSSDSCSVNIIFDNGGYEIAAGQSETFKIFLPVATLGNPTGNLPNAYMYSKLIASSGFVWKDVAGNATNSSQPFGDITSWIYNYPSTVTSVIHN